MFWKHCSYELTCLILLKQQNNSANEMWWFKYLFANEETKATKVQWLAKVSTGKWWEFNSSPGALSCTLTFLPWQGKGVWYHIHSEQKHTLSFSSSCVSGCSGSLLSPLFLSLFFPSLPSFSFSPSTWTYVYSRVKCAGMLHYKVISPTTWCCDRDHIRDTAMRPQ